MTVCAHNARTVETKRGTPTLVSQDVVYLSRMSPLAVVELILGKAEVQGSNPCRGTMVPPTFSRRWRNLPPPDPRALCAPPVDESPSELVPKRVDHAARASILVR